MTVMSRFTLALLLLLIAALALGAKKLSRDSKVKDRHNDSDEDELSDVDVHRYVTRSSEKYVEECKDTFCDPPIIGKNVSNIKKQKTTKSRDVRKLIDILKTDIDTLEVDEKMRIKTDISKITIDFFNYKSEAIGAVIRSLVVDSSKHSLSGLKEGLRSFISKLNINIVKHMDTIKKSLRVLRPPCNPVGKYETTRRWTQVDYMARPKFRSNDKRMRSNDKRMRSTKKFAMYARNRNTSSRIRFERNSKASNMDISKFVLPL